MCGGAGGAPALPPLLPLPPAPPAGGGQQALDRHQPPHTAALPPGGGQQELQWLAANCPSSLQDPRLGVHKYVKVNGVKLHYVEAGSERDEHGELRPLMVGSRALNEDSWR